MLAADVWTAALTTDELDASDIVQGTPTASSATLAELASAEIGIWRLTEGQVTDTEVDEVFIVLAGQGRVELEDGSVLELQPGTVARLRAGERTAWTITETLRKIYIIETGTPIETGTLIETSTL
ncbi:cupin domain-containing protein [Aeromicrobium sp. UC242_57]